MNQIKTNSPEETYKLGKDFAKKNTSNLLALYGDLGSGKTTFIQGLAKGLGINQRLVSPTFVLVREYELTDSIFGKLFHIDLYRLDSLEEVENLGILDLLKDPRNLLAIEWAEKMEDILPKKRTDLRFNVHKNERIIEIDEN